ncbi:MAG: hypothetical protein AAF542_01885 [Pseudomonadota bacterium]
MNDKALTQDRATSKAVAGLAACSLLHPLLNFGEINDTTQTKWLSIGSVCSAERQSQNGQANK